MQYKHFQNAQLMTPDIEFARGLRLASAKTPSTSTSYLPFSINSKEIYNYLDLGGLTRNGYH